METKICRICGKVSENYVHIFKTEGLKNKIETCLPVIVSPHCLLPDTVCSECSENVDNFYSFIKNCLQNIIILEAQYDIHESCLKTKRKHEKGSSTDSTITKFDKNIQTDEDFSDIIYFKEKSVSFNQKLAEVERILTNNDIDFDKFNPHSIKQENKNVSLVDYDVESESSDTEGYNAGKVELINKNENFIYTNESFQTQMVNKQYFADTECSLIDEITQRKNFKRKNDEILPNRTKIFKMDPINRRKSRQPKKFQNRTTYYPTNNCNMWSFNNVETNDDKKIEQNHTQVEKEIINVLPQSCLLCDMQFGEFSMLTAHVFEVHGIDMAQIVSSEPVMEKKKKIPNLVKITDLKHKGDLHEELRGFESTQIEEPPTLQPSFVCPVCPLVSTNRFDLFTHLRTKHPNQAALVCGLCVRLSSSCVNLSSHIEKCRLNHAITSKYICKICAFNDDNSKLVENHMMVHDFILLFCKKQSKMFDPSDYIETNSNCDSSNRTLTCDECGENDFASFKEFSNHRRNQHQIFHCDLCNKFYGRNSHLWKHVNRLHKGHPSITCQLCYKTSASKYHLATHFNKIHSMKHAKTKTEDFLSQKFEPFDFQSVKQSFMKQELLEQNKSNQETPSDEENNSDYDSEKNSNNENLDENLEKLDKKENLPKEIDSTSDLYTNIITNYTPPQNEGEFKCPKCFKGFHKKTLLKKHKKNCRPRLQKDLLTRCKTCSRIFKDRQSLTKHLINYHSEYACEICNQKVQSKCEIVSHIRFSHPNCHLFCHCGNILRNKSDLVEHKKDHHNSFVCQFCADMLPTKIKLKMHILSLHRKILSLSCGICLKLFETQHILRDHVRLVHKDHLTPLTSCTVCGKNYGSKWKTYDHLNKSHGRIFKACKACLEVFDSAEDLQSHYDSTHLNSSINTNPTPYSPSVVNNIKKDMYESDFDEYKNSLSDLSADDAFDTFQPKPNENEHENDSNTTDNKISLLEKRLLGKKIFDNEADCMKEKKTKTPNTVAKVKKTDIKTLKKNDAAMLHFKMINFEEHEGSFSQNPLHNSSKRTVYVNSNDPSLCEICLKTWPAKKHLWQHYIRCHKRVAATVCGICLKANENYQMLQQHLRDNHPTLLHGQGFGSNFICRICGRYHNASSKLRLHMAIHDNFDWSILEKANENESDKKSAHEQKPIVNGYAFDIAQPENEDINFESLIEQVECSSESENDSELGDVKPTMQENTSSTDNDTDNESNVSDSLETQMLKNMLREKELLLTKQLSDKNGDQITLKSEVNIKNEYTSSESDDSTNSSRSYSEHELIKSENCTSDDENSQEVTISEHASNTNTNDSMVGHAVFASKAEELDSAIRSISYEQTGDVELNIEDEYAELPNQNLNQHEIQSAVDSIL